MIASAGRLNLLSHGPGSTRRSSLAKKVEVGCTVVQEGGRFVQATNALGPFQQGQRFAEDRFVPRCPAHPAPCQEQEQLSSLLGEPPAFLGIEPLPVRVLLPIGALEHSRQTQCFLAKV